MCQFQNCPTYPIGRNMKFNGYKVFFLFFRKLLMKNLCIQIWLTSIALVGRLLSSCIYSTTHITLFIVFLFEISVQCSVVLTALKLSVHYFRNSYYTFFMCSFILLFLCSRISRYVIFLIRHRVPT